MKVKRDIRTDRVDVTCDVCGRTLLRGENSEPFLAGGERRQVCDLCTARAAHEGWIRESGGDELGARRPGDERRRSLITRLRQRRERASELSGGAEADQEPGREAVPPAAESAGAAVPRSPRNVRAVPTNADLKVLRALELFNTSEHPRTVAGIQRSLGPPVVSARPMGERPSVVAITVAWELSWYRYEVDLSDEATGVQMLGRGLELAELGPEEREANAAADDHGELQPAVVA